MRGILRLAGSLRLARAPDRDGAKHAYDSAGRLASIAYPDGTVVGYTYDAAGNLIASTVMGGSRNSARRAKPDKKAAKKTRKRAEPLARQVKLDSL